MFKSANDYLDVQFRLLREDFVRTLRNGIKELKDAKFSVRFKPSDVNIYRDLQPLEPNFGSDGITHRIS